MAETKHNKRVTIMKNHITGLPSLKELTVSLEYTQPPKNDKGHFLKFDNKI